MYFIRDNPGVERDEPCCPIEQIAMSPNEDLICQSWKTGAVVGIAEAIRESKDYSVLPILADALQDAGCENPYILNHCRFIHHHATECWVISEIFMISNDEMKKYEQEHRKSYSEYIYISRPNEHFALFDEDQSLGRPRYRFISRMLRLFAFWTCAIIFTILFEILVILFLRWLFRFIF